MMIGLSACSENETPKDVPFEMMPDGLKKSVEAELMEKMKQEVIDGHQEMHQYYSTIGRSIVVCFEWQNSCRISRNLSGQIKVHGDFYQEKDIKDLVYQYYTANESLTAGQTVASISNHDYEFYNFPFYSRLTKNEILKYLKENRLELEKVIATEEEDFINFYQNLVDEWEQKLVAIEALGVTELKEIHPQAHIRVHDQLSKSGLSPLTIEAFKGLIQVRDYASRKYFNLPYMDLYFQGTRFTKPDAEKKLAAINHLFEMRITDYSYAELNDLETDSEEEPELIPSP